MAAETLDYGLDSWDEDRDRVSREGSRLCKVAGKLRVVVCQASQASW